MRTVMQLNPFARAGRALLRELAELVHNVVAHPLLGVAGFMLFVVCAINKAAGWFHEVTAEWAWPEEDDAGDAAED
jgi:hypothetical protein